MKVSIGNNRAQRWISAVFAMVTPWRAARVVASGALLAAVTVMYFNLAYESTAGSPPLLGATPAAPAPQPQRFFGEVEEDLPVAPDDRAGLIRHMADHLGVSPQAVETLGTGIFRHRPEEELALSPDQEVTLRGLDIQRRQRYAMIQADFRDREAATSTGLAVVHGVPEDVRRIDVPFYDVFPEVVSGAESVVAQVVAGPHRTVKTTGGTQFVPNNLLRVNLAFAPGPLVVDSGDTVTWVHTDGGSAAHTITIVDEGDLPTSVPATLGCRFDPMGVGTVCMDIITAHGNGTNPVLKMGIPVDELDGLNGRLDSLFLPSDGSVSSQITAPSGTILHYFCGIHPLMQGSIKVR